MTACGGGEGRSSLFVISLVNAVQLVLYVPVKLIGYFIYPIKFHLKEADR